MKKNGFTLVELMAVIAIIAILSVIIVPSVITVNKNVNERLYKQKIDNIESAAELYASNNPDIFNGADRVYVYVYQLIDANYLDIDTKFAEGSCVENADLSSDKIGNGCITDPRADSSTPVLNDQKIVLVKKNVGVVASFESSDDNEFGSGTSSTLVDAICAGFGKNFDGMYNSNGGKCTCDKEGGSVKIVNETGADVSMCMIVSNNPSGDVDNWLKYGSTQANWRVLGLYWIDTNGNKKQDSGEIYPKMITSDVVQ